MEWEILDRYGTQTEYQIVEGLKDKYKITSIFNGIERLERPWAARLLLSPIDEETKQTADSWKQENGKPKLLVPFHFTKEKTSLDYLTNLNRYQLLIHLGKICRIRDAHLFRIRENRPKTGGLPRLWGDPDSEHRGRGRQCLQSTLVCQWMGMMVFYSSPNS